MVIVFGFQILVDGWLTKLSAPIVIYDEHHTAASGSRSTSLSRISCSAGRWSPRCCCCGNGSGCATATR